MQYFKDAEDLLALFEIDPRKPGAQDFLCLCDLYALMSRYASTYDVTVSDLARVLMQQRRLSPLVFWSRMKRAIRPLICAEQSTLTALGVPGGMTQQGHEPTCAELAARIGGRCGVDLVIDGETAEIAAKIATAAGRAK